jgi:hypothetical protein
MDGIQSNWGRRQLPVRRGLILVLILALPWFLGGWRVISGETINPRLVQRIQDGKTTKHEILAFFGEPQEIDRTPEGPVFHYKSFKDAPAMPYDPDKREPNPQSTTPFVLDPDKQIKKAPLKTAGKILRSTLTVRFTPDGETAMSHEYKEY